MRVPEVAASVIGLLVVCCLASAWVLPRCMPLGGRSKESECQVNLKALYAGQHAYREDRGTFSAALLATGFEPEYGNRYLYLLDPSGLVAARYDGGSTVRLPPEASGVGPDTRRTSETIASLRARLPTTVEAELGLHGDCDAGPCGFTAACIANLDDDDTPDVWTVSTAPTVDFRGDTIPPGQPAHRVSDAED